MSKQVILTYADGKVEVPKAVQEELQLSNGTKLRLMVIPATDAQPGPEDDPLAGWVPNETWRSLQGILSGHPEHDTTKARAEERAWELAHDERKFGPFPMR